MVADRLGRLLRPRSVAFVGGRRADLGATQTVAFGYEGPVWTVHPNGSYPTLGSLPAVPDAVFIGVSAPIAIEVVEEAKRLGVGGAVVYPSGFAETGHAGEELERRLVEAAGTMPILGPNCHGFINAQTGAVLWPDVHGCARTDRGVAIFSQSGNLAINLTMQQRALPVAIAISLGNQAVVTAVDCLEMFVDDPTITAFGLHLEGIPDTVAFGDVCRRAHAAGKRVTVLKTGKSSKGAELANSHTASLAGSNAAHAALFRAYGIASVDTVEAFLGALTVSHVAGTRPARRVVSLSCSGGEASLVADLSSTTELSFPTFSTEARSRLDEVLEGRVSLENPLDYHTYIWDDAERLEQCFTAALADGADVGMLVLDFPRNGVNDGDWWRPLDAFARSVHSTATIGVVTSSLPENLPLPACSRLISQGIAPVPGLAGSIAALDALTSAPTRTHHQGPPTSTTRSSLTEATAKALLAQAGMPVPPGIAATRSSARAAADELGYPVVLKSQAVVHRSDAGGVALNITGPGELERELESMASLGDEFLVERMIDGVVAEMIVGIRVDDPVGWTLTLGAGGIWAEAHHDVATILLPAGPEEIATALDTLAIDQMLAGEHGQRRGDRATAIDTIAALGKLALERRLDLEVNPLLVCERGVWIADALVEQWM